MFGGLDIRALRSVAAGLAVAIAPTALVACSSGPSTRSSASTSVPSTTVVPSTAPSSTSSSSSTTTTVAVPPGGPVPSGFQPASVTFVSATKGYVLGWAPCASAVCTSLVRTSDGGRTWAGIPAPAEALGPGQGNSGVSYVRFADAVDGWVFGSDLWSTHDGGGHWTRGNLPGGYSVAALEASGSTVYALGLQGTGQADGGPAQLFQSPAGADSWTSVTGAGVPGTLSAVLVTAGTGVWVVAQTGGGGSVVLARTGSGWVRRSLPCSQPTLAVAASSALNLDAVCSGGGAAGSESKQLYLSADGGQSWRPGGAAPLGGDTLGVATANPATAVIGAASGASWLYATFDGGSSWSTVYQDTSGRPWRDIGFTSATQGVAVEGAVITGHSDLPPNQLLITIDGGHTWAVTRFA